MRTTIIDAHQTNSVDTNTNRLTSADFKISCMMITVFHFAKRIAASTVGTICIGTLSQPRGENASTRVQTIAINGSTTRDRRSKLSSGLMAMPITRATTEAASTASEPSNVLATSSPRDERTL